MFEKTDFTCPNCLNTTMDRFFRLEKVPVHSVMNIYSQQAALDFPTGKIHLGFCPRCGFIANMAFDPEKIGYSQDCEESQGFSPTFNRFLEKTAADLIEKYGLNHKKIVEIGCGKGDFLRLLCRMGENHGIGIDPAWDPNRESGENTVPEGVTLDFIQDYYSPEYRNLKGDMVCCRMTLEHIHNPHEFVSLVRSTLNSSLDRRQGTPVFFQVPDTLRILNDGSFEDVYYEHCSYFTPGSLARLFRQCGFKILHLGTVYDGQYIVLEAIPSAISMAEGERPVHVLEESPEQTASMVSGFVTAYQQLLETWQERIQAPKTVLWGSGSKAVSFLNALDPGRTIEHVVDINPHRQGTFMAGTGQKIVPPEFLKSYKPGQVIIMNRIYRREIEQMMADMGVTALVGALGEEVNG